MAEKVTVMEIKVDLECSKCYKKIKKVLCKFPQIRDQMYDTKNNIVLITVVCCNPEKVRQKICCKGGDTIKSIEIKEPPKPKPPEKPKEPEKPKAPEKPKEPEKPKAPEKPKEPEKPIAPEKPKPPKPPAPAPIPIVYPPAPPPNPIGVCCRECYEGNTGGPCFRGYGGPPPPCYEGYGRPVYDSWGGGRNRGYYPSRCDYFCEENPSACTIM